MDGREGLWEDGEVELGGEPHGAHHAQRVVGEGAVGITGGADDFVGDVLQPVEGVHEGVGVLAVEGDGHGVDGEVAAKLVILKGAVLHDGLAGVAAVGLATGAHKLDVAAFIAELGGTEVAIDVDVQVGGDERGGAGGELDAAAHGHDVDVGVVAPHDQVTHHTADHVGVAAEFVGRFAHKGVYGMFQIVFVHFL